jgi:hypothetical protein
LSEFFQFFVIDFGFQNPPDFIAGIIRFVFVFLDDLSYKMKYVFNYMFGDFFDYWVPEEGSLLDMTVKYSDRQREVHKKAASVKTTL